MSLSIWRLLLLSFLVVSLLICYHYNIFPQCFLFTRNSVNLDRCNVVKNPENVRVTAWAGHPQTLLLHYYIIPMVCINKVLVFSLKFLFLIVLNVAWWTGVTIKEDTKMVRQNYIQSIRIRLVTELILSPDTTIFRSFWWFCIWTLKYQKNVKGSRYVQHYAPPFSKEEKI